MTKMKRLDISFLLAMISAIFVNECSSCFQSSSKHDELHMSGDAFYKECTCEHPVLSKRNLKWVGPDDTEIKGSGSGRVYTAWTLGNKSFELHISRLDKSVSGVYTCVSEGMNGKKYTISYNISVYEPAYFINANKTQYLINGRDSQITCQAKGYPDPEVFWSKGQNQYSQVQITSGDKYEINTEGLVIKNVSKDDEGMYQCKAQLSTPSKDISMYETYIKAEVLTPPVVREIIADREFNVEGNSLILDCVADGFPLPEYTWRKVSNESTSIQKNVSWHQDFNKLIFENVTEEDRGVYECQANSIAGDSAQSITVEVYTSPTITWFDNITVAEGSEATIKCSATGRPTPNVQILVIDGDVPQPTVIRNETWENSAALSLIFDKIEQSHSTFFYCNASNEVGHALESMYVEVRYMPHFDILEETIWAWEEKPVNLSCEHDSNPLAKLTWSFQGNSELAPEETIMQRNELWSAKISKTTDHYIELKPINNFLYGTYECIAMNDLGSAKKIIHVKKGSKPPRMGKGKIIDITASSVTFELTAPKYTGCPVIGFIAEYDKESNYAITNIHSTRTWAIYSPYKLDNLTRNTSYFIRFAAINEVGTGSFGELMRFETPDKSVPEPPTWKENSDDIELSAQKKTLKLKSPEDNGDPIDYYVVKYCSAEDELNCTEKRILPTTDVELDDLTENATYMVEMVAHNSVGNSTPARLRVTVAASKAEDLPEELELSGGTIIGISVLVVIVCIVLLDLLLLATRKKGMIATCCFKKNKKRKDVSKQSRDKKGLLKDNSETPGDTLKRPDNGHKEFEYNKSTGVITGKHSSV